MKISVIMPTCRGRERLLNKGIEYFDKQDYPNKELIIIGDDYGLSTVGAKRNHGCSLATGDVICHFDDDDYYAPDYLARASRCLFETEANITGLSSAYFYNFSDHLLWLYQYAGKQPYVIESGMMYRRQVWEQKPFSDTNSGEGLEFQCNAGKIVPHNHINGFMAMIHGNNTASHKQLSTMKRMNPDIAQSILGENFYLYTSM